MNGLRENPVDHIFPKIGLWHQFYSKLKEGKAEIVTTQSLNINREKPRRDRYWLGQKCDEPLHSFMYNVRKR